MVGEEKIEGGEEEEEEQTEGSEGRGLEGGLAIDPAVHEMPTCSGPRQRAASRGKFLGNGTVFVSFCWLMIGSVACL